jgi:predicted transcriptional regulator
MSQDRVLKTHIIQYANLKTPMAERYLTMLKQAGYITEEEGEWGERKVIYYELTDLGRKRYSWFQKINAELYE